MADNGALVRDFVTTQLNPQFFFSFSFQAQKCQDTDFYDLIWRAATPGKAKKLGRSCPLRDDWNEVRLDVMRDALRMKFTQHSELRDLLLSTHNKPLVEHTHNDHVWADGGDGSGQNLLGQLLMEVREELRRTP